jgi:hypothetical protein
MSIEQSHGAARATLPRSSDLTEAGAGRDRTEGRDPQGRFTSRNPWAPGTKWRALIAEGLGRELEGKAGELGRRAYRLFRAFLADLPCDCASVRSLVAQRARAVALADAYAARGAELGILTSEGLEALQQAARWDARAERLAVTSWDVSTVAAKAARSRHPKKVIDLLEARAGEYLAEAEAAASGGGEP